jgi:hypothetical protein
MPLKTSWFVRAHDVVVGAVWGLGVFALVRHGLPESLSRELLAVTGSTVAGDVALGLLAAAECWIALALLTSTGKRARVASLVAMSLGTAWLVLEGVRNGWSIPCGCFEGIWESSIAVAILRNLVLLAWTSAVLWRDRQPS